MREQEEMRYVEEPRPGDASSEMSERPAAERPRPEHSAGDEMGRRPADSSLDDFRARFDEAQARFIDDPKGAVEAARSALEAAVDRFMALMRHDPGATADTEQMRLAMRRYRALFDQLSRVGPS